jgi:hypothetical protein
MLSLLKAHFTFYKYTKHPNLFFLRRSFHSSVISKSIITQLSPSKIITIPKTPQINNIFSFSLSRRYTTTVIKNPQKDEEGNDMCIEITDRAVKVITLIKIIILLFIIILFNIIKHFLFRSYSSLSIYQTKKTIITMH